MKNQIKLLEKEIQKQLKITTMTTLTVQQLIKHFETFNSKFSVLGADELSNYETICRLKRLKRTRVFNVQNDENDKDCIFIWQNNF